MNSNCRSHETTNLFFAVEPLERRAMLAGNVSASINAGGDLIIQGDGADNKIEVFIATDGTVVISGHDGETVDQGNLNNTTVTGDVRVRMRGGNDTVELTSANGPINKLIIRTGSGSDSITVDLNSTQTTNVLFVTGSGNDRVDARQNPIELESRDSSSRKLTIRTGGGEDNVRIRDFAGEMRVHLGSADDTICLDFSMPGTANGGGGYDKFVMPFPELARQISFEDISAIKID
jgi:hypothetical protein